MPIRNLSLFIVDDRPVSTPKFLRSIIDVNVTPYGWIAHCLDAADNKQLSFDLLSSDINYSEDGDDPGWSPSLKGKFSCWGLVHALAVLARRKLVDEEGNVLPLEWEIRSVTPEQVQGDLWATRLYGLLRSLAAQPKRGESLCDCIRREHAEKWSKPLETAATEQELCSYPELFTDDLVQQKKQDSLQEEMVERLLPNWRTKLFKAVKDKQLRLHLRTLEKLTKRLKQRLEIDVKDPRDRDLCIPLSSSATGDFAYGISLFSVLADLFSRDRVNESGEMRLDTVKKFDALQAAESGRSGALSIHEWLDLLRAVAGGVETPTGLQNVMYSVSRSLEECLAKGDDQSKAEALEGLLRGLDGDYTRRGILYILMVARRQILGFAHTRKAQFRAAYYHIYIDPQTFTRPLREQVNVFPKIGGPDKLGIELCNAMSGSNHRLGAGWEEWIKPGLLLWYDQYKDKVDPRGKNRKKFAPGL
jgi:hypothetical protein